MKQLIFPTDFNEMPHSVMPGSKQWKPTEEYPEFVSIVGGGRGLYGDGITSFEIMIGEDVEGWLSIEEINAKLATIPTPDQPTGQAGHIEEGFTGGEWEYEQTRGNNRYEHHVFSRNGGKHGSYVIAQLGFQKEEKEPEEIKANARLICEAPAMLSIVKRMLFMYDNEANYPPGTIGYKYAQEAKAIINRIKP